MLLRKDQWTGKKRLTKLGWLSLVVLVIFLAGAIFYLAGLYRTQATGGISEKFTPSPESPGGSWGDDWLIKPVRRPDLPYLVYPPPPSPSRPRPSSWPVYRVEDRITGKEKYEVPREVQEWIIHDLWEYIYEYNISPVTDHVKEDILLKFCTPRRAEEEIARRKKLNSPNLVPCGVVDEKPWRVQGMVVAGCSPDGRSCTVVRYRGERIWECWNDKGEVVRRWTAPPSLQIYTMVWDPSRGRWLVDGYEEQKIEEEGEK